MTTEVFCHMGGKINDGIDSPVELPGWYFWDESTDYHGPFATREEAIESLRVYVTTLLG